jgi:hypothetical protein
MLNLLIIALYLVLACLRSLSPKRIYNRAAKIIFSLGPVRQKFTTLLAKAKT